MPIGSRRSSSGEEYVFIDGKAMRSNEAVRVDVDATDGQVPGKETVDEATGAPIVTGDVSGKDASGRKKWSAKRALNELESSDAFAPAQDGRFSYEEAVLLRAEALRATRRRALLFGAILLVVTLFSLCLGVNETGTFYSPVTVVQALAKRVYLGVGQLLGLDYWDPLAPVQANQEISGYADIGARFDITLVTLICGFLLALAGMLYQNVFRNPLASPTMLGVSSGVRIGTIILVLVFNTEALYMEGLRYAFCYVGGIIILLAILGFSKVLAGKHRPINVVDMLIAGSVFAQVLQVVSTYFLTYVLDDEGYTTFYELTTGARTQVEWYTFIFLGVVIVIAVLPVILMRFRLNAVSFEPGEARLLGVDPERLRVVALVLGTLIILAAQIHVGVISMISLVVPFLVRYLVGSEFGEQVVGNMLLGPAILLVCRDIISLIPFVGVGLSLEMVVGFVALPVYIWMMALGKRGWE